MAQIEVFVKCNSFGCNTTVKRFIDEKYVRKNGTLKMGSYCNRCLKKLESRKYRGRTSEEIAKARDMSAFPVKIYSDEEKAQYAKERGLNYEHKREQ